MSIGTNALIFWLAAPFFIDFSYFLHPAMLIFAASPIFSMLLSIVVFRREILTLRIVAAVFIVMPSVVLIAVH